MIAPEPTRETLLAFVVEERELLWHDLQNAVESAVNRAWSMEASNYARRIVEAARLVGPGDPEAVPWSLYAGGVWRAVLEAGEIPLEPFDPAAFAALDARMLELDAGGSEEFLARYARTLHYLEQPRERAWVRGDDE